jgi:predicted DNA-binding protein (MmcQ/YjbR family)
MKTQEEIQEYLTSLPNVRLEFPFGENTLVYSIIGEDDKDGKMFALIAKDCKPPRLSLRCDPILAKKLREIYETVLPGQNLNKNNWNTIICTGQIPQDELKSLITLSYNLASDLATNG